MGGGGLCSHKYSLQSEIEGGGNVQGVGKKSES